MLQKRFVQVLAPLMGEASAAVESAPPPAAMAEAPAAAAEAKTVGFGVVR